MASNEWSGIRKLFLVIIFLKNKREEKNGGRLQILAIQNQVDKSVADVE